MNEVTIRTDNSVEGIEKIHHLWQDVMSGNTKLVLNEDTILISRYSNYDSNETGLYDLSILSVNDEFFKQLNAECVHGKYRRYDFCTDSDDISSNIQKAWELVWDDQKNGKIKRCYTKDYECIVLANQASDHKFHCLLYIAIEITTK